MAKLDPNSIIRLAGESRVSVVTVRKYLGGGKVLPAIEREILIAGLKLGLVVKPRPQVTR
jgi:hypothetical protein